MNTLLYESVLQTHCFSQAAIIRRKDYTTKAKTLNFPVTNEDMNKLAFLFEHPTVAREQGVMVGDLPYRVVRADSSSIYGKLDEDTLGTINIMPGLQPGIVPSVSPVSAIPAGIGGMKVTQQQSLQQSQPSISGTSFGQPVTAGGITGNIATDNKPERDKTIVEYTHVPLTAFSSKSYQGIIVCRTSMYFIVGIYDRHPGMAVEVIERLADWFRSKHK